MARRLSREQHFSRFAWNNTTLNLASLHFAALDADSNSATGDRFAHARFHIAKNDLVLRAKTDYLAYLDIIHEFHTGRIASDGFDHSDRGSSRSSKDQLGCDSCSQASLVHFAISEVAQKNT